MISINLVAGVNLTEKLYKCIVKNQLLLEVINEHAIEGYLFYNRRDPNLYLFDAKLGARLGYSGSVTVDLKASANFYDEFIQSVIASVEASSKSVDDTKQINHISIGDKLFNSHLSYCIYRDLDLNQDYYLVAIKSSQFLNKENLLDLFTEMLDLAAWQCNIQTGELYINKNWAEVIGYTWQELQPPSFDTFAELTHPNDLDYVNKLLEDYSAGIIKEYKCEVRMKHKNGHWVWVLSRGRTLSRTSDGRVEWMIGSHIDITDRKIHEEEADILALVPIGTFNSVIITDAGGKINFVNNAFENLTGYKSAEVLGQCPGDFLRGPNTKEEEVLEFSSKLKSGQSFSQSIVNYTRSGREFVNLCQVDPIYNEKGELTRYISIQKDITEEVKVNEYLNTFKATLDQTEDCIFIFDGDTFEFTYVNKGAKECLGYEDSELLVLHPYDIKPEYPYEKFLELIQPLKNKEVKSKRFNTLHRTKSGQDIPVEVFLQYIIAENNEKEQFIAIVQDITERLSEKRNLERLSVVAENTTNLVIVTDKNNCIEYVNNAFELKTGYTLEEIKNRRSGEFLNGPETDPKHIKAISSGLRKKIAFKQEILNYTKSGEPFWVEIAFNPIWSEDNKLRNYIAIETDITERKIQEAKILESEERLQFVLKGSELGYWDWYAESGQMTVNDRWYQMLGYERKDFEVSIDKWHSLVHPEDMVKLEKIMTDVFPNPQKSEFSTEIRAKHKKGHYIWILDRGAVVQRDKSGAPLRISGMHMEISQKKKLERELEKERNFLSKVISTDALALVIINRKGELTYANAGAEYVLGLTPSEIENKVYNDPSWRSISFSGEPFPKEELPFIRVMKSGKPVRDVQHGIIWRDGTIKFISVTGGPFNFVKGKIQDIIFSVTDITERVQTEQKLQITQNRLESILEDMTDVIWSADTQTDNIVYITASVEQLTGYDLNYFQTDFQAIDWEQLILKRDIPLFQKALSECKKTGSFEVEYRINTKEKEVKWVLNRGRLVYENGSAVRLDCIMTDITKRKTTENEIQGYIEIVEAQNERLKNFAYIVSHNLRSHSANIQGLMLLIQKKSPDALNHEYIKMLNSAANKLDDTLHHLSEVVSVVSSSHLLENVNISEAISSFIDAFEYMIEQSGIFFLNEVSSDVQVNVVPAFIESIIINLLTNAIKYRDPSKSFSYVKISSRNFNGIVTIVIEDNGLGIDLDRFGDKIFGMYKTFHQHEDSRGLGLFLTKNQVESMGGKIEVESQLGEGSTFKVFLKDGNI